MAKALALEKVHLDYDEDADVLYIDFGQPQAADDSDVTEDGVIVRLSEGKIVGVTILNALKKLKLA